MKKLNSTNGYTLVEMIIYISLLFFVTFLVANTIVSFSSSYRDLLALRRVEQSALGAMERITRDVRAADSIDAGNSTFAISPGALTLITVSSGTTVTKRFYIDGNILKIDLDGTYFGPLTASNARITQLMFNELNNGISRAIKTSMTIEATVGGTVKSKKYYSTVILRGE